ncbi:DUF4153 domain-containing protein [Nonomuraea indica]|uniref:Signal transduction histidine-protein kinase/phosphatase MprB n=1 Tax=Nonomuraea indica TaxID=1581193 RepID=A0ABW8A3Z8_9ACTN
MRPLDFLGRIKVKLGIVIVLAVATAFVVNEAGLAAGLPGEIRIAVAVVLSLIMVQVLARGMTKPLREMARAAQTIAKGRYTLRVRATSRDEVGELARAFNAMAADLGEVDRQRRELVANVSHELRTPITGLRAVLENVVDGVSAPDPGTMRTALAQADRLGRLVAQLLDLSRLDSGARLIEREDVELASLVGQALREAALAREDVRLVAPGGGGLVVRADPDLLAQVLANLLDNAVRHSPPGGVVTVDAEPRDGGVRITVADQGPGIPASARARVFERFSRLDAARAADAGGAGLGLAIVKEIVELHGGSIRIDDCAGCRMVVDLPGRTPMPSERHHHPPAPAQQAAPPTPAQVPEASSAPETPVAPAAQVSHAAYAATQAAEPTTEPSAEPTTAPKAEPTEPAPTQSAQPAAPPVPTAQAAQAAQAAAEPAAPSGRPAHAAVQAAEVARPAEAGEAGQGEQEAPVPQRAPAPPAGPDRPAAAAGTGVPVAAAGVQQAGPYAARAHADAGGRLGRMVAGTAIGLFAGFIGGVFVAVFVSVLMGDGAALLSLVLSTSLFGAVGLALGAGPGRGAAPGRGVAAPGPHHPPPAAAHHPPHRQPHQSPHQAAAHQAGPHQLSRPASAQRAVPPGPGGQPGGGQPPPPYVPPPLFPQPELPETPRWLLPAAAGAGVFGAVALPGAQAGLGVVLVATALGAAALPALLRRMTPWTLAFGVAAYWLIAMAAVRDADWLVGLLLTAGGALAALAVSGAGRGWLGVIRGGVSVLLALGPVAWFLGRPLKRLTARRRVLPMLAGLGITVVLLLVFGLLFVSADAVFAAYAERLTSATDWAASAPLRIFLFAAVAAALGAVVLVALRPVNEPEAPEVKVSLGGPVWKLPLTAVNLLFGAFVAVQITVLFGGDTLVLRTRGLTYAEYARQGFFQLVVVSVFVLGIVGLAGVVLRTGRRDRWVLAGLLGLLCALTMVVLVSALHRLHLYTAAYGLSRLRVSVEATVWWLGALFVLVLLAGAVRLAGRRAGWLPRTVVLVTALGLGAFAMVNPDLRVAETQVGVRGVAKIDSDYLGDLGAEAVPALDRLPEPQRSCVLAAVVSANGLAEPDPWNGWNLARSRARDVLALRPIVPSRSCSGSEPARGS